MGRNSKLIRHIPLESLESKDQDKVEEISAMKGITQRHLTGALGMQVWEWLTLLRKFFGASQRKQPLEGSGGLSRS